MGEVPSDLVPIKGDRGFSEDIKKIQVLMKSEKLLRPASRRLNPIF
jgi:hypothetical protein